GLRGPSTLPRSTTSMPRAASASTRPATRSASGPMRAPRVPAPTSVGAPKIDTGGCLRLMAGSVSWLRLPVPAGVDGGSASARAGPSDDGNGRGTAADPLPAVVPAPGFELGTYRLQGG